MWSQSQIYKTSNIGRSPASYPISFSLLPAPSLTSGYFFKNMISSFTYCYQQGCVYTYMYLSQVNHTLLTPPSLNLIMYSRDCHMIICRE